MTTPSTVRRRVLTVVCVLVGVTAAPAAAAEPDGQRTDDREVRIVDLAVTPPDTSSWATHVDDAGTVFGGRTISFGPFTTAQAWRWDDGRVTDLVGVGQGSAVTEVNERGDAAGYVVTELERSRNRAVLWRRDGTVVELGPAGVSSRALDVNRRGVVVGESQSTPEDPVLQAALWQADGTLTLLDDDGAPSSRATAIDDRGRVAGHREVDARIQAVRWDRGRPTDFPPPHPDASSSAVDINRRGQVLVEAVWNDDDVQFHRWYVWDGAQVEELPVELASGQLTDRGEVVGTTQPQLTGTDPFPRAVVIRDGVVTDLGSLGQGARVTSANERGQVVGASTVGDGPGPATEHAVLFDDGEIVDLGTLGGPSSEAADVNRRGRVVGSATADESGVQHAVLWTVGR